MNAKKIPRNSWGRRRALATTRGGTLRLARLDEQRAKVRPEVLGDRALALRVRMDAVALVEADLGGDALQEERHERDVGSSRHLREHRGEVARVPRAVVRRHAHAGEQHAGAAGPRALDDRDQVVAEYCDGLPAEPVVRA